jgi:arylsulfatase
MELDHNIGRMMEAVQDAGIEDNTIFVFVSDNGPTTTATLPNEMYLASAGPWRGELGDANEGSIRTVGMIKWPGHIKPGKAEGMVSIMDFLPTFANIIGAELPDDRPIDGIDQTDYLLGNQDHSNREHLITFIGSRLAAVRWRQWRIHLMNFHMTDNNPSQGGYLGYRNEIAGYPIIYNIEADPREMRNVAIENTWVVRPMTRIVGEYLASLKDHPNPPAANVTVF